MTTRDRLTLAAALAVVLATSALRPLYEDLGWVLPVLGAIVAVSGAAALARTASAPRVLQPCAAVLALLAYTALTFAGSTLAYGLLPTTATASSLAASFREGMGEVEVLAPPVPTTPELVLLAVLGAGAVMVVVDLLAVVLRKVAVSGLPLLVLFAVPSAVLPDGIGFLAFVLGASGWLGLLLADGSDRVSRWGTPLRSARGSQRDPGLGRVGRRIGGAALGVAVVVPVLVPGLDGQVLGGNGTGGGLGGSRTTTTYNPLLSLAGQLRQEEAQTLLTTAPPRAPTTSGSRRSTSSTPTAAGRPPSCPPTSTTDQVQDGDPAAGRPQRALRDGRRHIDLAQRLGGPWLPVPPCRPTSTSRAPGCGTRRPRRSSRPAPRSATSTSRTPSDQARAARRVAAAPAAVGARAHRRDLLGRPRAVGRRAGPCSRRSPRAPRRRSTAPPRCRRSSATPAASSTRSRPPPGPATPPTP
jgi:hypothetical protein